MKITQSNREENLLLRLRNGDEVAFELIFYKFRGKLFDFVRRSLQSDEEVENIVQDTFTKLWIYRHQLDSDKSLNALLYTIARNEVFGHLRKLVNRRKYLEELGAMLNESEETTERQLEYNELKYSVNQLIKSMPERRREIFILSRYEGQSYKQIAKKLSVSENTVDTQIRKALAFLRESLRKKMLMILFFFLPAGRKI